MKLKYNVDDRLPLSQLLLYALQWFILAVAVVVTSVFVAQGSPAEKLFYSQKMFMIMGLTGLIQVIWGHRLPLVVGPAAVLLVGVMSALASNSDKHQAILLFERGVAHTQVDKRTLVANRHHTQLSVFLHFV